METLPALQDIQSLQSMAKIMVESRYFNDTRDIAQACVKIMAGQELGISPVAAMRGIDIVKGQISIRAHLMAAMVKRSGKYDYRVVTSTNEACEIEFFELPAKDSLGVSAFSMDDAQRAKLTGNDNYVKYPKAMLYNRAMSNGARMYCPDLFLGAVYEENEIEVSTETPPLGYSRLIADVPDMSAENPVVIHADPASKGQMGLLMGKLKGCGVRDGHKRILVQRLYKDEIPKEVASAVIRHIETNDALPARWFVTYIQQLIEGTETTVDDVTRFMIEQFQRSKTSELDGMQQRAVIDWLTLPAAEPTPEVTVKDWVELIKDVCTATTLSTTDFSSWLLATYSDGEIVDPTQLPAEVFCEVQVMEHKEIKERVAAFLYAGNEQPDLIVVGTAVEDES